jgi:hypothetical protein
VTSLATERLVLEPLGRDHLAPYTALIADPLVHRYLSQAKAIAADPAGQAERIVGVARQQWRERAMVPSRCSSARAALSGVAGCSGSTAAAGVESTTCWRRRLGPGLRHGTGGRLPRFRARATGARTHGHPNPDNAASAGVLSRHDGRRQRDFGTHIVDFFAIDRADWARD